MRRRIRRHLLALVCLGAAGLIGVGAIVDRHVKQARIDRAELAEWYCSHQGTRCGGPSSDRIEARWNRRELGYEIAVGTLGALGVVLVAARSRG